MKKHTEKSSSAPFLYLNSNAGMPAWRFRHANWNRQALKKHILCLTTTAINTALANCKKLCKGNQDKNELVYQSHTYTAHKCTLSLDILLTVKQMSCSRMGGKGSSLSCLLNFELNFLIPKYWLRSLETDFGSWKHIIKRSWLKT